MNLELKHLAAYLPYNLKVLVSESTQIVMEMISCQDNSGEVGAVLAYNNGNNYWFDANEFKPILRPLSHLTKEIEINGEKFVPLEKIFGKTQERDVLFERMQTESFLNSGLYRFVEYQYIVLLLEWHFDIFGLIDAGLAIDYNTLKNNTDGSTLLQP